VFTLSGPYCTTSIDLELTRCLPSFHLCDGIGGLHQISVPLPDHRPQLFPLLVNVMLQALTQLFDLVDRVVREQGLQVGVEQHSSLRHVDVWFRTLFYLELDECQLILILFLTNPQKLNFENYLERS